MLATGARAGVRSEGERLRFGGASQGKETDMETDPSSAPSPSPSSYHAPSASAEVVGARPHPALLVFEEEEGVGVADSLAPPGGERKR